MSHTSRSSRSPLGFSVFAATFGVVALLVPAVNTAPASAGAKTNTDCAPNPVTTSYPTPAAATSVSARKYGAIKGKAQVSWSVPKSEVNLSGYQLYMAILTSGGRCTDAMQMKPGQGCVKVGYRCLLKRLPGGNTEFQVALWYQTKGSKNSGPVAYSAWSNSVNVK